ncbi:DegT/DnrJ/EryC1/StrS family aminotransferase [Flavobacteriaceae bacterium]|nr:DegT/DnrJ/EryC1/StrS family aminotransferase [Flavobacteriaceae bacterium]
MRNTFFNEKEVKQKLSEYILDSNILSMNQKCFEFEKKFADYQNTNFATLFNSGGSANLALLQSLKNLGKLKDGDKIGFSALTWSTNVMPIIQMGFEPVPIDIDYNTLNVMSYNLHERLKELDLDGLFLTNVLGFLGDLDIILQICDEKNILLIEDNCESLGAELPSGKSGNFGLGSSFSFYVAHHMSTIEGGMLCSMDEELTEMLRIVRANGWDRNLSLDQQKKWRTKYKNDDFFSKYSFYDLGFNVRPTNITGFLGLEQLNYIHEIINLKTENFKLLNNEIKNNPDLHELKYDHMSKISPFSIPIVCKSVQLRNKYVEIFTKNKVEIRPMIAGNMQNQPFYNKYVSSSYDLPNTDLVSDQGFYFGNFPELTKNDLEILANCLKK